MGSLYHTCEKCGGTGKALTEVILPIVESSQEQTGLIIKDVYTLEPPILYEGLAVTFYDWMQENIPSGFVRALRDRFRQE